MSHEHNPKAELALVEEAVVPALLSIIQAIGKTSEVSNHQYKQLLAQVQSMTLPNELKVMLREVNQKIQDDSRLSESLTRLASAIEPLNQHMATLTQTTNELVNLQKEQNEKIEDVLTAFTENTSRLLVIEKMIKSQE